MKCIEARRMVTSFIKRRLPEKDLEQFLKHIEHCDECMDELDIHYTMYKALDTLDSGAHQRYDFKEMLNEEIRTARRMVRCRRLGRVLGLLTFAAVEVLLILSVMTGYRQIKSGMADPSSSGEVLWLEEAETQPETETQSETAFLQPETEKTEN